MSVSPAGAYAIAGTTLVGGVADAIDRVRRPMGTRRLIFGSSSMLAARLWGPASCPPWGTTPGARNGARSPTDLSRSQPISISRKPR